MAGRINLKTIDYYRFRKMVIDGNRDDYTACSKEVKALCDCVQTISFRDEEFDDVSDRVRFDEICGYYRLILQNKRIDPADMRIKSGWWGDHRNAYSAGKLKASILKATFISKATEWVNKHSVDNLTEEEVPTKIDGPGLYVFKHKEHQCYQFVGRAERVFAACAEKLKAAFEGNIHEPLASLLLVCMASDWDFYFIPVEPTDGDAFLRVLENDLVLKHDSIWPHGLNFHLHNDTLFEVSEFRRSCLRHHWPPPSDPVVEGVIDFAQVRKAFKEYRSVSSMLEPAVEETPKQRPRTPAPAPATTPATLPRTVASNPSTNELSEKTSSKSLTRKSSATTPAAAATTPRSERSIQRPTSARKQRSTPTPTPAPRPTTPRGRTKPATGSKLNQQKLRRAPAPKPKDVTPPASPSPSPSPTPSPVRDADASPPSPVVQEEPAIPPESGRRRTSSSSSRGTWTIDDGSGSPPSFSPEQSPPLSPAKSTPRSPSRIPAK